MNGKQSFLLNVFEGAVPDQHARVWPRDGFAKHAEHIRGVGWGEILFPEVPVILERVQPYVHARFQVIGIAFSGLIGGLFAMALCRGVHPTALGIFANDTVMTFAVAYLGTSAAEAVVVSAALVGALLAALIASLVVIVEYVFVRVTSGDTLRAAAASYSYLRGQSQNEDRAVHPLTTLAHPLDA